VLKAPTLLLTVALAAALAGASPASAAVHATQIATFSSPVYATSPPADPHRLMVVEQAGKVMIVKDGVKQATPFLDITSDVKFGGEQGLLSIAFAPDYATSRKFYVYHHVPSPRSGDGGSDIVIDEYTATDDDHADPASKRRLVTIPHPTNTNHNGGQLQVGPDGRLYAGTGDGGSGNDPPGNAQNPNSMLGKLLVIDRVNGGASIYAMGLRNPFRFSFDRLTGDLTIGDVGQDAEEEVDFAPAGTGAGVNYGWRCFEGFERTANQCDTLTGFTAPVLEQSHSGSGFCAIIGGYVVRDPALTDLLGRYIYGDNCQSQIRSAHLELPRATGDAPVPGLTISSTSSFGEDSCGHVYVTSLSGPLYRLDGDAAPAPCPETAGPGATADTTPPVLTLTRSRTQKAVRTRGFVVAVSCNEACGFTATGRLRISGHHGAYVLGKVSKIEAAGKHTRIRLRLSSRATRALRGALAHHKHAAATLTVVARDSAGNQSTGKVAVTAKR
jgi:hypothetical protein